MYDQVQSSSEQKVGKSEISDGTSGSARGVSSFQINTKTDTVMEQHECAYISVLEEYKRPRR